MTKIENGTLKSDTNAKNEFENNLLNYFLNPKNSNRSLISLFKKINSFDFDFKFKKIVQAAINKENTSVQDKVFTVKDGHLIIDSYNTNETLWNIVIKAQSEVDGRTGSIIQNVANPKDYNLLYPFSYDLNFILENIDLTSVAPLSHDAILAIAHKPEDLTGILYENYIHAQELFTASKSTLTIAPSIFKTHDINHSFQGSIIPSLATPMGFSGQGVLQSENIDKSLARYSVYLQNQNDTSDHYNSNIYLNILNFIKKNSALRHTKDNKTVYIMGAMIDESGVLKTTNEFEAKRTTHP